MGFFFKTEEEKQKIEKEKERKKQEALRKKQSACRHKSVTIVDTDYGMSYVIEHYRCNDCGKEWSDNIAGG